MNVKLLVDGIMRQTTVLIAQLSTSAGVRAPLAHLADQVFLSLAKEIEAQGIGRKVVADMFGLALRSYQRKTQRLTASASAQGKTLFEAVLEYVESQGCATRDQLLSRFEKDGERETIGVLTDLVQSGLLYATGSGEGTLYGVTSDAERQRLTRHSDLAALSSMALGEIYRNPGVTVAGLARVLAVDVSELETALGTLRSDGRVTEVNGELRASTFQLPIDAEVGWESAVFDHFQAVATTIVSKLRVRTRGGPAERVVGGSTLRFEIHRDHPMREEVLALLDRVRQDADALWLRVANYNDDHPVPEEARRALVFYFGQSFDDFTLADPDWREE